MPMPDEQTLRTALRRCWSLETALQWTADRPELGQCNVTAVVIHDLFGGEILQTPYEPVDHFYNRIDGVTYDFTDGQFDTMPDYQDESTSREVAMRHVTSDELRILTTRLKSELAL